MIQLTLAIVWAVALVEKYARTRAPNAQWRPTTVLDALGTRLARTWRAIGARIAALVDLEWLCRALRDAWRWLRDHVRDVIEWVVPVTDAVRLAVRVGAICASPLHAVRGWFAYYAEGARRNRMLHMTLLFGGFVLLVGAWVEHAAYLGDDDDAATLVAGAPWWAPSSVIRTAALTSAVCWRTVAVWVARVCDVHWFYTVFVRIFRQFWDFVRHAIEWLLPVADIARILAACRDFAESPRASISAWRTYWAAHVYEAGFYTFARLVGAIIVCAAVMYARNEMVKLKETPKARTGSYAGDCDRDDDDNDDETSDSTVRRARRSTRRNPQQ